MKELRQDFLIYGKEYDLFRDGQYIGSAVWTDDNNIGDSFIQVQPNGEKLVFVADEWTFKQQEQ
jgi:hypothetical protein